MTKLNKAFVWFLMLTKRLLLQWGFVVLLCSIPIIVSLTNIAMKEDSGIMHVALSYEHKDEAVDQVISRLTSEDGVMRFSVLDDPEMARRGVKEHKYDAAWIFSGDYKKNLDYYIGTDEKAFITVIQREENIPLQISREKLFAAIYTDFSYSVYKNFMYKEIVSENAVPESELKNTYDRMPRSRDIIRIEKLDSNVENPETINYLNVPIRGILSLLVVLCTLAGAMYFLKDTKEGKFDWMPYKRRAIPAWASCFSAALLSGIIMLITLQVSGIGTGVLNELLPTFLFLIAVSGFGTLLCFIVRSPGRLGALIPGIIIVMLVLSPIFFNLKVLAPISRMLPTYYYLYSVYNHTYLIYTCIYCAVVYGLVIIVNYFASNLKGNKSII